MVKATVGLMVIVLAAGCVSKPEAERWSFVKQGVSEADAKRDRSQCFAASVDADARLGSGVPKIDRNSYRACMEQRGYTVRVEK